MPQWNDYTTYTALHYTTLHTHAHTHSQLNAVIGNYWPTWSMKAYSHYEHGQDTSYGQQGHFITRLHKPGRDQLNLCRLPPTTGDVNEVRLFMWPLHDHQQTGSSRGNQQTNTRPPPPPHQKTTTTTTHTHTTTADGTTVWTFTGLIVNWPARSQLARWKHPLEKRHPKTTSRVATVSLPL